MTYDRAKLRISSTSNATGFPRVQTCHGLYFPGIGSHSTREPTLHSENVTCKRSDDLVLINLFREYLLITENVICQSLPSPRDIRRKDTISSCKGIRLARAE
jgi:hypothetical protein